MKESVNNLNISDISINNLVNNIEEKITIEENYKNLYIQKCKELEEAKNKLKYYEDFIKSIENNLDIKNINSKHNIKNNISNPILDEYIDESIIWKKLKNANINNVINEIKYLLIEFGTKELCNRFDVGNAIEFIIGDLIKSIGFSVKQLPNEKRIDLSINDKIKLSVKYSSSGDITLHN
jgi:hypothetical protein